MNIRKRLVAWHAIILAGLLLIFTAGLYMALTYHLYAEVDGSLRAWASNNIESFDDGVLLIDNENRVNADQVLRHYALLDSFVLLVNQSGQIISEHSLLKNGSLKRLQRFFNSKTRITHGSFATVILQGQSYRIYYKKIADLKTPDMKIMVLGRSLMHVQETLTGLAITLMLAWVLAVIICSVISWVFVGRTLHPVKTMTQDSQKIAISGEPGERIKSYGGDDEFDQLAHALNNMLESKEATHATLKKFLGDVSHELRTPLTSLKANLDFLKRAAKASDELKSAALDDIIAETNRMTGLVNELLMLARAEAQASFSYETVNLTETFNEVAGSYQSYKIGNEKNIIYETYGTAKVYGDREKLRQVMVILLDNAIKYTPPDGRINLKLWREDSTRATKIIFQITDNGPGIPDDEIDMVFDRFYRATNLRDKTAGSGLGLSIVKSVITNHGGEIVVNNMKPHGLQVTVTFSAVN